MTNDAIDPTHPPTQPGSSSGKPETAHQAIREEASLAAATSKIAEADLLRGTGYVERGRQYAIAAEKARLHAANADTQAAANHWATADTLLGPLDTANANELRDFIAGAANWDERRLQHLLTVARPVPAAPSTIH